MTHNRTRRRVWLAVVVTPLLTPLAFFVVYAGYFHIMGYSRPGLSWVGSLMFMYLFGLPVGYVAISILGWPWIVALRRWRKLSLGYVCAGACVIGAVTFTAFSSLMNGASNFTGATVIEMLAAGSVMGLLAGLIFCGLARVPLRN